MDSFWSVFLYVFWVFAFVAFLMMLFLVLVDLFRDPTLNGWWKAVWVIFLIFVPVITVLGLSGLWEIIESWVARAVHPELGITYLGSQGDIWDAQKDMAAAFYGSLLCMALLLAVRIVRRLRAPGPLTFGRGIEISISVDELAFEGANAFLLGAVLDRYFARHVSNNSFIETLLRSESRGEVNRWVPQWGTRPTL